MKSPLGITALLPFFVMTPIANWPFSARCLRYRARTLRCCGSETVPQERGEKESASARVAVRGRGRDGDDIVLDVARAVSAGCEGGGVGGERRAVPGREGHPHGRAGARVGGEGGAGVGVHVALCADEEDAALEEEELGEGYDAEDDVDEDSCGAAQCRRGARARVRVRVRIRIRGIVPARGTTAGILGELLGDEHPEDDRRGDERELDDESKEGRQRDAAEFYLV